MVDKLASLGVAWGLLLPWVLIGLRVFAGYAFCDRLLAGLDFPVWLSSKQAATLIEVLSWGRVKSRVR